MVFKSQLPDVEPDGRFKGLVSNFFWAQLDTFARRTLLADFASRRHWSGASIKEVSARVAQNLVRRLGLEANFNCITFCYHNDHLLLNALAVLFAGGSVCAGAPEDPSMEHAHMLATVEPQLVYIGHSHLKEMLAARRELSLAYKLVLIDDDSLSADRFAAMEAEARQATGQPNQLFGYHRHLCAEPATAEAPPVELPVQVSPERPSFVIMTSGSTGKPKPVNRSQRNSLYVCHSLVGAERLWDLNESSVLAGHLQLDHGTGIFCLKQMLARGLKLVVMHGYEFARMLEAVRTFAISDICLGSALLHNLMGAVQADAEFDVSTLASLRNFIAVGSPIASHALVSQFMERFPQCSVRQAYGATECGFACIQERESARQNTRTVGHLLPNVTIKLVRRDAERAGEEIEARNCEGELYLKAPTVSPGYLGERFREQSRAVFLPDGFYKSNDMCSLDELGQLHVLGRYSDVLCLHDGWKVLPSEIEAVILEHPLVAEAVVVGIPHPELPTCHAPRAYIVPRPGVQADFDPTPAEWEGVVGGSNTEVEAHPPEASPATAAAANNDNNSRDRQDFERQANGGSKVSESEVEQRRVTHKSVFEFVAARLSEPKHLVGGIRIMRQLPRISIGKYDRKLLRKMDGF